MAKATVTEAGIKKIEQIKPQDIDPDGYEPSVFNDDIAEEDIEVFTPQDRIPSGTAVYVRNNQPNIVRFTDWGEKADLKYNFVLQGNRRKGSVLLLESLSILGTPGFQRWWRAGKVTVSNDPRMAAEIDELTDEEIQSQIVKENKANYVLPRDLPVPAAIDLSFLNNLPENK